MGRTLSRRLHMVCGILDEAMQRIQIHLYDLYAQSEECNAKFTKRHRYALDP